MELICLSSHDGTALNELSLGRQLYFKFTDESLITNESF